MKKIIGILLKVFPRRMLIKFSFAFSSVISLFYTGNKVECPVCGGKFRKFLPYGHGNRINKNRLCPKCLSLERHRLIWLFLKNETGLFHTKMRFLHIAPEQSFLPRFKSLENLDYVTADLESPIADVKMDVRDIPFENGSFDFVMCNHVLEHIDDEQKALKEIHRVLRKGGFAIMQVPMEHDRKETFEDSTITHPKERAKIFGQYDHVRTYGTDYPHRLEKAGFTVDIEDFVNTFTVDEKERYCFDMNEKLYIAYKT